MAISYTRSSAGTPSGGKPSDGSLPAGTHPAGATPAGATPAGGSLFIPAGVRSSTPDPAPSATIATGSLGPGTLGRRFFETGSSGINLFAETRAVADDPVRSPEPSPARAQGTLAGHDTSVGRPTAAGRETAAGHDAAAGQDAATGGLPNRTAGHAVAGRGGRLRCRHGIHAGLARSGPRIALLTGTAVLVGVTTLVALAPAASVPGRTAGAAVTRTAAPLSDLAAQSVRPGTGTGTETDTGTGTGTGTNVAGSDTPPAATATTPPGPTTAAPTAATAAPRRTPAPNRAPAATGTARTVRTPAPRQVTTVPVTPTPSPAATYGQTVDRAEPAPAPGLRPVALPLRPQTAGITAARNAASAAAAASASASSGAAASSSAASGSTAGTWVLDDNGDAVTLTGRGYLQVRWDLLYQKGTGVLQLPVWTGLKGKLFHVASGGGHRMDDAVPAAVDRPHTWMGRPSTGYDVLPSGAQQMWQIEYYYLDGTVTLHNLHGSADYRLDVSATRHDRILADLVRAPGSGIGVLRYGIVRDTGTDAAPVPQYLTRRTVTATADLIAVPQRSTVS